MPKLKNSQPVNPPNADNPMTIDQARKLAATMRASADGLDLFASVDRDECGDRITFAGGRWGAHSCCRANLLMQFEAA